MIDARYPDLSQALADSRLFRLATGVVDAFTRAWDTSRTAKIVNSAARFRDTRTIAAIAAVAVAMCAVTLRFIPAYVRPGLPLAWPIAAITAFAIVAVCSAAFDRAWADSNLARALASRHSKR